MMRNKKAIRRGLILCGIIISMAVIYFVVVKVQQSSFSNDRVTVKVSGPSDVSGSEASLYVFTYVNANRSDLTNVELALSYPENFQPSPLENMSINGSSSVVHIGKIAGNSQGKVEVQGKFYGSKGTIAYIKGILKYQPQNIGSSFQSESQIGITIQSPSIKLVMDAPLEVASGGVVEYRLDYTNMSDVPFDNLRLKVEYPGGFQMQTTDPKTSEGDAVWYIGSLLPGKSGSIHITGTVDGSKNEAKVLKAHIGVLQGDGTLLSYSDSDRLTKIVTSPLSVQQTVNGLNQINVDPNEGLHYVVNYRNDGEIGLRDVIITLALDGSSLDFSKLQMNGGAFDDVHKVVTWKASDVRALANLAPKQEGSVGVYVPVLANIPTKTASDKNFVITSLAKIDSPDIPTPTGSNKIIGSNSLRVRVNSGINLQSTAMYEDPTIQNTGANPPVMGQETTYTLHWIASNATNDVNNATVSAYLPTGMRWTGKISPTTENLIYNDRTNQIVWNIGTMANGVGALQPAREVMFQVGLTPQINQAGQLAPILGESTFTAHDLFTNEDLHSKFVEQKISIPRQ